MESMKRKIEFILRHYSPEAQTIKAIEELAELQAELAKMLNKQGGRDSLIGEMADAYIMLTQLMVIFDIDAEEFDIEISRKLDRQIRRIEEGK